MSRGTQDAASSPVHFPLRDCHTLRSRFPAGSRNVRIGNSTYAVLQPPFVNKWVWAFPISLAATFGISVIYFPSGTEMVHFPELAHTGLCIQPAVTRVHLVGFPHSEIPGSKPACGSPRLIAACHVLLRLLAPRHPPYALSSLIIKPTQFVVTDSDPNCLRRSGLLEVAKLQVSSGRSPCLLQIHYSVVRFRGAGTIDSAFPRCLSKFALLSTVLLNISSRTCNHSHPLSPRQTVICPKFRRECANLSVVKDRVP